MDNSYYHINLPYPKIEIIAPDRREAGCLAGDYAGRISETTAILTYIYQSYVLSPSFPDVSKALEQIAVVEMHHHEMLGDAIVKLHGDPVIGGSGSFWNGSFVNYEKNVRRMLENDIRAEEAAIAGYRKTLNCLYTPSLKKLVERIIQDEQLHIKIFRELLDSIN